jgi:plasmid stabilization system protein ParE
VVEINWTNEAEKWLKDIHEYIKQDSTESAFRVIEGIYEKCQILSQFPEMGYKYEKIPDKNIRILLYGHYRIAYLIKDTGNIDILGIFHGALEIERYMNFEY